MSLGRSAALTDAGRKRRRNEDAHVCEPPLFAVADGMGGAQAGELASQLAAAALREGGEEGGGEEHVAALIREANRRVYQRSSEDKSAEGMGTTITVALVEGGAVRIGHVGDSRAYLLRDGELAQLTEDHSLVAELVRSGRLSPEEAESHPQRSVITRVLGADPDVVVDTFSIETRPGDLFLLCSDGLTSMVDDGGIRAAADANRSDLNAVAAALVAAANRNGGEDNITVVCFEIAAEEDTAVPPAPDEDTLSGLAPVPVVETPVREDEWLGEAQEAEPGPAGHRVRRWRRLLWALGGIALVAVLAAAAVFALSRSHFVGVEPDGHVAVYQGVPWNVAGRVRLYRVVLVSPLLAAQLTQAERRKLFAHSLQSKGSAVNAVLAFEKDLVP